MVVAEAEMAGELELGKKEKKKRKKRKRESGLLYWASVWLENGAGK